MLGTQNQVSKYPFDAFPKMYKKVGINKTIHFILKFSHHFWWCTKYRTYIITSISWFWYCLLGYVSVGPTFQLLLKLNFLIILTTLIIFKLLKINVFWIVKVFYSLYNFYKKKNVSNCLYVFRKYLLLKYC